MMRTKAFFSGLVLAAVLALAFGAAWYDHLAPARPAPPVVQTLRGQTMGTTYSIRLVTPRPVPPAQLLQLRRRADELLEDLNNAVSTYRPRSTIVRFNQSSATTPVDVGEAMAAVVRRGLAIGRLTGGAFDITLDAAINAWGFDAGPRRNRPPLGFSGKLANTRRDAIHRVSTSTHRVSTNPAEPKVHIEPTGTLLRKRDPDTRLNLSGIAKGYGVDRLADLVAAMGFERFMVEIGGEVRARGTNRTGGPWRVGIEQGDNYELSIMDYGLDEKKSKSLIIHHSSSIINHSTGGPWRVGIEPGDNYELSIMDYGLDEKKSKSPIIHHSSSIINHSTGGPWRVGIEQGDNYELSIMDYGLDEKKSKSLIIHHSSSIINHSTGGPWRVGIEAPVSRCHPELPFCHPERSEGSPHISKHGEILPRHPFAIAQDMARQDDNGVSLPVVLLRSGQALATSGTTRNSFTHKGKTYSHILDPRTRTPVRTTLLSVSIVAGDCMTADALATAAMVLGEPQTRRVLKRFPQTHALFMHRDPVTGQTRVTHTSGFPLELARN